MRTKVKIAIMALIFLYWAILLVEAPRSEKPSTSSEWRDDEKNLIAVQQVNRAYARLPFSREYEGVLDVCPFQLDWTVGPNLPVAWKGGVAGLLGNDLVLVGGMWMPGRKNLAFAYNVKDGAYREIPAPPFETAYTQGTYDAESVYVIGGRSAGRNVAKLGRARDGGWKWTSLPSLPESEGKGRWLATANSIQGKWLFLMAGHPTGTPSEERDQQALTDWRLRLDRPNSNWESMAPYPGGPRALLSSGVVGGKLYVFGGSHPDPVMRSIFVDLVKKYSLQITPYQGVPQYRDAYCYNPDTNTWQKLRSLPFPMSGGAGVVLHDRYILLMGTTETKSFRAGKTDRAGIMAMATHFKGELREDIEPYWTGYNDVVLCYDVEKDNYSRVGVMLYGVATCPWLTDGTSLYGFGGEPYHRYNDNTENVLQVARISEAHN